VSAESEQRDIVNRLNALCLTVEGGFRDLKKDVGYLGKFYVPLAAVSLVAMVLAILSLAVALENRNLIVSLARQSRVELQAPYVPVMYSIPSTTSTP
jgi:hypothetical protein